jgi:hypothetical protein
MPNTIFWCIFLQNAVAIKGISNFLHIHCSALAPNVLANAGDSSKLSPHGNLLPFLEGNTHFSLNEVGKVWPHLTSLSLTNISAFIGNQIC